MMQKKTKIILNLLLTLLLAFFLWWAQGNLDGYKIQILNLIAVNAILALSLNLIYGFTGMFSLGHAGFMAIGAYVSAILILPAAQKEMMYILEPIIWPFSVIHAPFFISVLAGGLVAALLGLLIALPVLRLGGDYLGIATLGFAEIIRVVFTNITPVTNGALGLKGIPSYADLGWNYFWCILTFYVIVKLLSSNFGNCLRAIRDDEVAAKAMGINTFKCKAISFAVGAFFCRCRRRIDGKPDNHDRPKDVQLPADIQHTDDSCRWGARFYNGFYGRCGSNNSASGMAQVCGRHYTDRIFCS